MKIFNLESYHSGILRNFLLTKRKNTDMEVWLRKAVDWTGLDIIFSL